LNFEFCLFLASLRETKNYCIYAMESPQFRFNGLKNTRTIFIKALFYVMALQILNQSIDFDYILHKSEKAVLVNYDDIDSFTEYLVETIVDDNDYTSEQDDDEGSNKNKAAEKAGPDVVYFEAFRKPQLVFSPLAISSQPFDLIIDNKPCKGHFAIYAPPPES
jgi:hypothetical protein